MNNGVIAGILGAVIGFGSGAAGMYVFAMSPETEPEVVTKTVVESDPEDLTKIHDLQKQIDQLKTDKQSQKDLADEYERLANEVGDLRKENKAFRDAKIDNENESGDEMREKISRIRELEGLLEERGYFGHLSADEIAKRRDRYANEFETAFATKDKKAALTALHALQALGPEAWDKAIELWKQMNADFGPPSGSGENTMGLTFQEYYTMISNYDLVEHALTDSSVDRGFRTAAIYGLPWWNNKPASERVGLAKGALFEGEGYERYAAIDTLGNLNAPESVQTLADFVGSNTDSPRLRTTALKTLAAKDTTEAWDAIQTAATNDSDEGVRKTAQDLLDSRTVEVAGIRITFVGEDSQGALAGIKVGDILTHYNGERVKTLGEVNAAKGRVEEGQSVKIILRRGKSDVTLTLGPGQIGINGTSVAPK